MNAKVEDCQDIYKYYVCPRCFNQIDACECPDTMFPPHTLIHVDIRMQDVIRTLNKKGYATGGCCESHFNGNRNMYVTFTKNWGFTNVPEGFKYDPKSCAVSVRMSDKTENSFEKSKSKALNSLMDWAEKQETKI